MCKGKIKGKALIVIDTGSILAVCSQKRFKVDYVALVQKICQCMQMDRADVETLLVVSTKQEREQDDEDYDYGFVSAMGCYFDEIGMSLEIVREKIYATNAVIAQYMMLYALELKVTHLVLVSGSLTFASTFALINKYRHEVYKIVCMWPRFLEQELRRQADAVYEIGKDILPDEINLALNRKKAEDEKIENKQMNLINLIGQPLAKTG